MFEWILRLIHPTRMPFQFSKNQNPESPLAPDFSLLIIRVITVLALGYYQIFSHLKSVWELLWEQKEWALIAQIEALKLPFPSAITTALILLLLLSMIALVIGIFTRINALVLLILLGFVLVAQLRLSLSLNPQTLVLYIGIMFALIFSGGGRFSLDFFLASRKARSLERH